MRWRNSCVLGLALAVLGAGCGDSVTPPTGVTAQGSAVVGAAGGRVTLSEGALAGAGVNIPAGALASSVTITVREGGAATELPTAMAAAGPVVLFGPEGQTFAMPVAVTVPVTAGATALYTRPAAGGAWTLVEGATLNASAGTMTGSVRHFSVFMALRMLAVDAGTVDAGVATDTGGAVDTGSAPTCAGGYADCDRSAPNGCETNLTNSASNCGACGNACPAGVSCVAGACGGAVDAGAGPVCPSGYGDCNANAADGCETNLISNASNCGACGNACPSGLSCVAGVCTSATPADAGLVCPSGRGDCNAIAIDGCETNLASDTNHCGACGSRCATGWSCALGACTPPGAVDAGFVCASGMADCDGNAANGCETNLSSNASSCGACGRLCSAGQSCVAGACTGGAVDAGLVCPSGYGNCNAVAADGCETNLISNASHCGACGSVCPAGRVCTAGVCVTGGTPDAGGGVCAVNHADCDGNAANGCEANLTNNNQHCGFCGAMCMPGRTCTGGACL